MHMQVMQQSLSQAHVIQVHKYCTKWETFQFALPARNLFTKEIKMKVEPDLSLVQDKFLVKYECMLAKSRNRYKLSLGIQVSPQCLFFIFLYISKHVRTLVIQKLQ